MFNNIIKDNHLDYDKLLSLGYPISFLEKIRFVLNEYNAKALVIGYDVPASYSLENFGFEHHSIFLKSNNHCFEFEYIFDNDDYTFIFNVLSLNVLENLNVLGDKNENK